ncbi:WHG domain-containing protein [Streptomyces sp. XM4193]|uniref:TetR/AcrR family transcriptional regulator n=1 Tax=Streptomyces sp. XM4193 TaxID=2929782 RepID=UPI001FF7EEC8|nr:TetR-like C-terminal domain-containing protein [Streptomyces sp. XM4193]MCK1794596.1 WHG domain-containing protein [Streptomyces sp. XM4193]
MTTEAAHHDRTTGATDAAEPVEAIKAEGTRQLHRNGALVLTPESVRTALGMTATDFARHFASRDALLTALVVDAYDGMGERAEQAVRESAAADAAPLARWVAVCRAVRDWATDHPQEYELIYGTNIPGYDAPPETMVAGARTAMALIGTLQHAAEQGALETGEQEELPGPVADAVRGLAEGMAQGLPEPVVARLLVAWTQLFGMTGFSVFGHIAAFGEDPAAFVDHAAAAMGRYVGVRG